MKYCILSRPKPFYTEKLLRHLATLYGHEVVETVDEADAVLISIEDITNIGRIEKAADVVNGKPIIAGGHLSKVAPKAMAVHADYVWIGHAFEFFQLQTLGGVADSKHTYYQGKRGATTISWKIDWDKCPVMQIDARRFYVWGGVGCSRSCAFCLTSWTERHAVRPRLGRITSGAKKQIGSRGSIKVISNEYSEHVGDDLVQDMLIADLIQSVNPNGRRKLIRVGIEFATEENRKAHGKPATQAQIQKALQVAARNNYDLHMFMIAGIDTIEEWRAFFAAIPEDDAMTPRIHFKWTNLEYQQKTPLWSSVQNVDFDRYMGRSFTDEAFRTMAHRNKRVRVLPIKYPAHAVWRMIMSNVSDEGEYRAAWAARSVKDMDEMVAMFYDFKPWRNDMSMIEVRSHGK